MRLRAGWSLGFPCSVQWLLASQTSTHFKAKVGRATGIPVSQTRSVSHYSVTSATCNPRTRGGGGGGRKWVAGISLPARLIKLVHPGFKRETLPQYMRYGGRYLISTPPPHTHRCTYKHMHIYVYTLACTPHTDTYAKTKVLNLPEAVVPTAEGGKIL